jgi:hypothetical protein
MPSLSILATRRLLTRCPPGTAPGGIDDIDRQSRALTGHIYLGGKAFVQSMQAYAPARDTQEIPHAQRRPVAKSLAWCFKRQDRDDANASAFLEGGYTQWAIAAFAGLSVSRVSRLIKVSEAKGET